MIKKMMLLRVFSSKIFKYLLLPIIRFKLLKYRIINFKLIILYFLIWRALKRRIALEV